MTVTKRVILFLVLSFAWFSPSPVVFAQGGRANAVPQGSKVNGPETTAKPLDAHQRFVYDVVRSAVALPQTALQDRLRVLAAAAAVISPIRPVLASARKLIDAGIEEKKLAPRATLALMDHSGMSSAWSQEKFEQFFKSLPANASRMQQEAPNLAAMYASASGQVDRDVAERAGLRLLLWLGKLDTSGDRTVAVNVTTGSMKEVLGPKDYEDALASDVMARQVAQGAGGEGEISHPIDDSISVLRAMQSSKEDRLQELVALPPPQRAREAAASGFASGTGGDRRLAASYFDLAFSSLNSVWNDRESVHNAAAIVQEVSEAAAQVDSVDALRRTRELDDTSAQAIGMISVARVVASGNIATSASR